MRKWIIGINLFVLLFTTSVYGHVSGAFGDFLVGIEDETTTEKLKREIDETKEEISALIPKVKELEEEYGKKEEIAVTKLQFYNTMGFDTLAGFILDSNDVVEVFANQRIVEKKLENYLFELNDLYLNYMQVKITKESLEGHEKLLGIIENNLKARDGFIEKHSNPFFSEELNNEFLLDKITAIWERDLLGMDEMLNEDSKKLNQNIQDLFVRKTKNSPFQMQQSAFNELTVFEYHFRSDHVYAHLNSGEADVILIGVITKDNENTASLNFEAGFINGIRIPAELLTEYPGFKINYAKLNPHSKGFYVEQANSAIVIQSAEKAID